GTTEMYIAMGLSIEKKMSGSVVHCYVDKTGKSLIANSVNYYTPKKRNEVIGNVDGVIHGQVTLTNGVMICTWTRDKITKVINETYDLVKSSFYLEVATGKMNGNELKYHYKDKA